MTQLDGGHRLGTPSSAVIEAFLLCFVIAGVPGNEAGATINRTSIRGRSRVTATINLPATTWRCRDSAKTARCRITEARRTHGQSDFEAYSTLCIN